MTNVLHTCSLGAPDNLRVSVFGYLIVIVRLTIKYCLTLLSERKSLSQSHSCLVTQN